MTQHGGLYPRYTPGPGQITTKEFADLYSYLPQNARLAGITHTVAGRVLSRRTAGSKLVFYDIRQHGETLQVVAAAQQAAQQDSSKFASLHRALRKGDIIQVTGHPGRSKAGELSLFATEAVLLSPCLHDIPTEITDPPDHTDPQDIRTRQRHLEMLAGGNLVRTLRTRALINSKIRQFLDSRGFIEVETPILSSACGGARARPFVTRGNAADGDLFLRIAPELYLKRLLEVIPAILRPKLVITEQQLVIGGLEKVYEIGKQFRNEGVDATHNPEFTTCEFYQAYANIDDLIATTEFMLHGPQCNSDNPYSNANPATLAPHTPSVLLDRLSAAFVEPMCLQPTFVVDIPAALSPLAKRQGPSSHLAARFELFIAGKEYCNAYEELNDPSEQRMRFKEQIQDRSRGDDEVPLPDVMFCSALEHALPPTGGWGLGIDRLAMLLAGHTHLRDVIAFPFTRPLS